MSERIVIDFPWPESALSPNSRLHWSKKAKAAKAYRAMCFFITKASGAKIDWDGAAHLWITFNPPSRRAYDDDNLIGRFKPGRDGMADAFGVNDKIFRIHPFVSDQVAKGGCVRVVISSGITNGETNAE